MDYEENEAPTIPNDNHWHTILCRAVRCPHNIGEKPLCTLEQGLELDESGICIFSGFWE